MSQEIDKERVTPPTLPNNAVHQPNKNHPAPTTGTGEGYKVVNVLAVVFALVGVICIFGGISLASEGYSFNWVYCISGIISAMFCFGWAVVMRVCAIYMMLHDDL